MPPTTPKESHMPDEYSASELGRAVERIELDIREIKTDVKQQAAIYVTRGEYEAWRQGIDREVRDIKTSLADGLTAIRGDLKTQASAMQQQTPQWWVIAALIVSALGVGITLILALAKGV
jgi:uncharacterized protein YhaN